jgi:GNAT superfamily N-acetyltransferase
MAQHTDLAQRPGQATYRIRRASQEDHDAIAEINRRAWAGGITTYELLERRHGPIDGRPWIEHIVDAVATHLAEPDVTTFVAELEGRVVGYAAAQIGREEPSPDIGIVSFNAVHPDHQGQGIGTALIKQVTGHLEAQGARVLAVWTLEADEPVRRIYERMGFEELTRFVYYSRDCHGWMDNPYVHSQEV